MNAKQELFVREYLSNGCNATRAAIAAGYQPRSAGTQGSRLLADAEIAAEIARRQSEANSAPASTVIDRQAVLGMLTESFEMGRETRNAAAMAGAAVKMAEMVGIGPVDASDPATQALHIAAVAAEARKLASRWVGDALESENLPRDATPAQLVGAASGRPVATPETFRLLRAVALAKEPSDV